MSGQYSDIHVSFYIKPINQESLLMYNIKAIPVPYYIIEELIEECESKYTYTKIKPLKEILAMGSNSQINLDYNQLVHCFQYNIMLFCENLAMNTHVKVQSIQIKILS